MRRLPSSGWSRAWLAVLLIATAVACSGDDPPSGGGGTGGAGAAGGAGSGAGASGGGGGGRGGVTGGGGTGGAPDAAPETPGALLFCLDVRNCVLACADSACAQRCVNEAPAAARSAYQAIATCSQGCGADDIQCRCDRECIEPGECIPLVDDCRAQGGNEDTFCEELCF